MISLNQNEVKLRQIISGFFHLKYDEKIYKYFEPSASLYSEVAFYSDSLEDELRSSGFLSPEEEVAILKDRGLWSDKKQLELETMRRDLDKLISERPKNKYKSKMLSAINEAINRLEASIDDLLVVRNSMFFHTVEYQKIYRMNVILISQCLRDTFGDKIWKSYEELEEKVSTSDIDELIKLSSSNRMTTKDIRTIARTEPWRTLWKTASKIGGDLFNRPISDLTKSQYELCYWSNVYDSVYESSDYPGQDVVDDDEKLDEWFIEQSGKYGKERKKDSGFTSNKKIASASEVFLFADTQEDAAKVYDEMNEGMSRGIISSRMKEIEERGALAEHELPDVKQRIDMEINRMSMNRK